MREHPRRGRPVLNLTVDLIDRSVVADAVVRAEVRVDGSEQPPAGNDRRPRRSALGVASPGEVDLVGCHRLEPAPYEVVLGGRFPVREPVAALVDPLRRANHRDRLILERDGHSRWIVFGSGGNRRSITRFSSRVSDVVPPNASPPHVTDSPPACSVCAPPATLAGVSVMRAAIPQTSSTISSGTRS